MTKVYTYFDSSRIACRCGCDFMIINDELFTILKDVREHFNKPLILNCVCRCPIHNKNEGGVDRSQHLTGKAADIRMPGVSPQEIFDYIDSKYGHRVGLSAYNSFVHVDVRGYKARW